MKSILLLFIAFSIGCASETNNATIHIDPNFTPKEQEILLEVIEEWFQAIPEARAPVEIGGGATIKRMFGDAPIVDVRTKLGEALPHAHVHIWADATGEWFENVIRHEFGHYLGAYEHSTEVETDALYVSPPPGGVCISRMDIYLVCNGRGHCNGETFPNCGVE